MKKSVKIISLIMTAVLLVAAFSACNSSKEMKKIGVIQYAQTAAMDQVYQGLIDGLKKEGYKQDKDYELDFYNAENKKADCQKFVDEFVAEQKDLIVAISSPAAEVVSKKAKNIQTIFAAVSNPEKAGLVSKNDNPGVNMSGTSDLAPIKDQISYMKTIFPNVNQIGIFYCSNELSSKIQAMDVAQACLAYNISSGEYTFSDTSAVDLVLNDMVKNVQAIYIPSDLTASGVMEKVAKAAADNNIPVFCADENMVKAGGFFSYGVNYYELGKKTAQMVAKVLSGEAQTASMPVEYLSEFTVVVNQDVMNKLGVTLPDDIKAKATFVSTNTDKQS